MKSYLGGSKRRKTTLELTEELVAAIEEIKRLLGIPMNAVFALGIVTLMTLIKNVGTTGKRRHEILEGVERELKIILAEAKRLA